MPRLMLSDELWSKLEKIFLQHAIYHKPDLRLTVEGMLYIPPAEAEANDYRNVNEQAILA